MTTRTLWWTTLCGLAACGATPEARPLVLQPTPTAYSEPESELDVPTVGSGEGEVASSVPLEDDSLLVPIEDSSDASTPEEHPDPTEGPVARFELRRGETIAHFSRWSEIPVETIADASGLDLDGLYPVGTEILVPVTGQALASVEARREAHHLRRVEGYLASRGGSVGTEFYRVQTGDTAWSLAQEEFGIPVWVLESFNPAVPLDALRPGNQLMVPVLADTVADAASMTEPLEDSPFQTGE